MIEKMTSSIFVLTIIMNSLQPQAGTKWDGDIQIKNEVTIVANNGRPLYKKRILTIDKELSFGEEREVSSFDVDNRGNVYLVDRTTAEIKVFNPKGEKSGAFGRKGQGPGEFQMPLYIHVLVDKIEIFDYLAKKVVYLSPDGTYLDQKVAQNPFRPIGVDSQGRFIGITILAPMPIGGRELKRYDSNLKPTLEIFRQEPDYNRKDMTIGDPQLCCALSKNDEIYWSYPDLYEIKILDENGKTRKIIKNKYDRISISEKDKTYYQNEYRGFPGKLKFATSWPAFGNLAIDADGRIFVRTYKKKECQENVFYYDLFDAEGRYLSQEEIPANINSQSVWKNERLYTIESDAEGYQSVVRYSIKWIN
jgi:hypothetical protein